MSKPVLAALGLPSRGSQWLDALLVRAKRLGCRTAKHRDALEVWHGKRERPLEHGGYCVDGFRLRRLWLGPRRAAVGVLPKRFYLDRFGCRDRRAEHDIVPEPPAPMPDMRQALTLFLRQLQDAARDIVGPPVSVRIEEDLLDGVTLHGANDAFPPDTPFRKLHEQAGFFDVPQAFDVRLCGDEGVRADDLKDYLRIGKKVREKRKVAVGFRTVMLDKLLERLNELDVGDPPKRHDVPVLFMLPDEQRSPSARALKAWQLMDRHRLPWRRAYATDDRTWSVADQIGSLLLAAGGLPHTVRLAGGESLPWSIGVDVSHRPDRSRVAAALITPDGRPIGTWTLDGVRKEDIPGETLRRLLKAAVREIPRQERGAGILVVRDGRLPDNETADDYRRDLGAPVTLVEFRKRNNPPVLLDDAGRPPPGPFVGWDPGARDGFLGFLVLLRQANQFDKVVKVWMPQRWDAMCLGREKLVRILAVQTLTPGLGLKPRGLPAPIYWADGIAGASDEKLKFRGQCATPLE